MTIGTTIERQQRAGGEDLETLRSRLLGEIVTRESASYDDVRKVPLLSHKGRPSAIVRAAGERDVVETVRFARGQGLALGVRSGGHSVAGYSAVDGAVILDLSAMRGVSIDPVAQTARVEAGARSVDLMVPAHAYGLALSTGDTATVGLGGLVTGGGVGFMARKHGLAVDNLLSVRMVTADGIVLTASARENTDLFWAVRGGGGNFGIATEFEFKLAPVGQILGGVLALPATPDVIRGYLELAANAPDDLTTIADLMHAPPAPFVPQDRVGELALMVLVCWTGDIESGERAIAPLRALAEPIADAVAPIPYPVLYQFTAPQEAPHGVAIRSMFADEHSDESIEAILDAMSRAPHALSMVQFRGMGGAVARVSPDETAFAHRNRRYFTSIISLWDDGDDDATPHWAWLNELWDKISGEADGVYVNFLADEGEARVREAYPGRTYDRLVEVKRAYDPTNMFCFNQNIKPS